MRNGPSRRNCGALGLASLVLLGACAETPPPAPTPTPARGLPAATAPAFRGDAAERYRVCMDRTLVDPLAAYRRAEDWIAADGGLAARHCAASALFAAGRSDEAATRLTALARDAAGEDGTVQAGLWAQAGRVWLVAENPGAAHAPFSEALALEAGKPDLWIDRALAAAALGRFAEALGDLDRALALDPGDAEARVLRANAHRRLGNREAAEADIAAALVGDPGNPEALLERGILHLEQGERDAARADWLRVVETAGDSAAGLAARRRLELLGP